MRKYRIVSYVVLLSVFAVFNFRCERIVLPVDKSGEIEYLQGSNNADVIFKVLDNHSYAPVSGAMITIVGVDSAKTDSTGTAIFDSVAVGSYVIVCRKSGFEGIQEDFSLTVDPNSNTVPVVSQSTDNLYMAKRGAAVKGALYYKKDDKIFPADGATIECRITNASIMFERPVVVTTSDDGNYSFTDLPEYCTYTITAMPYMNGSMTFKQAASVSVVGRAAGDTLRAANVLLEKYTDGTVLVLSHNLNTFTKTDSLKFEFSEAIDLESITADSIYITQSASRILTRQIWKNDNKTLVIIPFNGAWRVGQTYTLSMGKITGVSGKPLDNDEIDGLTFTPAVTGELGNVEHVRYRVGNSDTIKADYNTSSITLLWSPLENAAVYQIYQKSSSDSAWTLSQTTNDTMASVSTTNKFMDGKQVQFIVLGKNSTTVSSFEDAAVLTVKDQKGPAISLSTSVTGFNRTTYDYLDTISVTISSSYLPEPMDTTMKPSVAVKEAGYVSGSTLYGDTTYTIDPNKCFWEWTTNRSGIMNVVIDANENGSYDTLKIDFTSVTDIAGNKPDTTQGRGFVNIQTRP